MNQETQIRNQMRTLAKSTKVRPLLRAIADTGIVSYGTVQRFYYKQGDPRQSTMQRIQSALDALGDEAA